jgi:outer membrane lipoprotein-sorting protein
MRIGFIFSLSVALLFADTLDVTLNRLDDAGRQFKGMTAAFKYVKYTAIVNESSASTGAIRIKRPKPGQLLGLFDFERPDKKIVTLNGQKIEIYLPNLKTVQEIDLAKHKVSPEQFFLFGFGTSRRDLEAAYGVSFGGPESVNGEATTRLVLISKNPDVSKYFSKFELWISDKTGQPVQQKFYEPSGDYNVFTYSDMKINPNLPDDELKLHLKGNIKREILK